MTVKAPVDPGPEIGARSPLTSRPLVFALIGVCVLVVAAVVWSAFGRSPQTVGGPGIILPENGYTEVGTSVAGTVEDVLVSPGDQVTVGQPVAVLSVTSMDRPAGPEGVSRYDVTAPVAGQIVDVAARPGRQTTEGESIAIIEPTDCPLEVKAFVNSEAAALIRPGMEALVSPADAPRAQYGSIRGSVVIVSPAPSTRNRLLTLLADNWELADHFMGKGPVSEVTVSLRPENNASGYEWSVGHGPPDPVAAGTLADVSVIVSEGSVISRISS